MAKKATRYIPEGYHTVTPYLMVRGAAKAIEFYKKAFHATELVRMPGPGGKVMHAEIRMGDSVVMLADEMPEMNAHAPESIGGTPVQLMIYVEDCDAMYKAAVAAGAKVEREVADQFYGDRSGSVVDPFGHKWTLSTHKEDVTPEEMQKRMASHTPM